MPVYVEMIKDKKTGKNIEKIVDGKKQYYIRTYVTDENGNAKQIKRHNKNWLGRSGKEEAEREEKRLRNEPIIKKEKKKNITLFELKNKYIENQKNKVDEDTLKAKITKLNHFCENDNTNQTKTYPYKAICSFDKNIYLEWQIEMKNKTYNRGKKPNKEYKAKKYSIKRLNEIHNEICNMIDFGIQEGYCSTNFARQAGQFGTQKEIKLSKQSTIYNVIDYEEYKKLMKATKDNLKYNTLFDLLFKRGPRIGEIRAFRVCDFDYEKKQLMVNHTMSKQNKLKEPKTASSKAPIDLDVSLNKKINSIINELKNQDGFNDKWYIFNGLKPISSHNIEYNKEKYFKLANINKHIRLHDFRHSCATWLFSININIAVISKILRHANINETLKTYTHLIEKDYYTELNKINKF